MEINKIIGNYLVFIVLGIFGFIVFWYSFLREDYFTVLMSLLLLLVSQFKIERICHNKGNVMNKEHHKKDEHVKHKLHHRIKHHLVHHAKKLGHHAKKIVHHVRRVREIRLSNRFFGNFKRILPAAMLPKPDNASHNANFEKPFKNSLHETFLDDMYTQVNDAGQINISQLAVRYGLTQNAIEEFAKILDKEKLVELYYPAIGIPVIRKLNYIAEMKAKRIGGNNKSNDDNNNNNNDSTSHIVSDADKKQKIINLVLFGILTFALVMIGYLVYLNKFAAQ